MGSILHYLQHNHSLTKINLCQSLCMQGCQHHHDQNSIQRTNHNNKGTIGGILGHIQRKYVLLFYRAITLILTTFVSSRMWSWMAHTKTSPSLSTLLLFRFDSTGMHVYIVNVCCMLLTKQKQMKICQVWKQNLVGVSIMLVAPATHVCRIRWKSAD